jgi:hypothetical protein
MVAGLGAFVASGHMVEEADGFYLVLGSRPILLPESGLLGDAGTYIGGWAILGLGCMAAAGLLACGLRTRDGVLRSCCLSLVACDLVFCGNLLRLVGVL